MLRYTLLRILWLIPIVLVVSFIIYALMDLAPGTVVDSIINEDMTQEEIDQLITLYDLDKPMVYRYGKYMMGLLRGDLGNSQITGMPVWKLYMERFPKTLELAVAGLILGVGIAIPLGIFAAKHAGTIWDNLTTVLSLFGLSMPGFWLGLVLLIWFSFRLKMFPAGYDGTLQSFILPAVTSGFAMMATTVRQTRSAMLEVMKQDYLRTARAKGVSEMRVTTKHALRNAWIPVITTVGLTLSRMLAGSAIVEAVYSWPGVGRMMIEAITQRDVTLACGCVILTCIMYVIMLLIVDLLYALVDPRIKSQYAPVRKKRMVTE